MRLRLFFSPFIRYPDQVSEKLCYEYTSIMSYIALALQTFLVHLYLNDRKCAMIFFWIICHSFRLNCTLKVPDKILDISRKTREKRATNYFEAAHTFFYLMHNLIRERDFRVHVFSAPRLQPTCVYIDAPTSAMLRRNSEPFWRFSKREAWMVQMSLPHRGVAKLR